MPRPPREDDPFVHHQLDEPERAVSSPREDTEPNPALWLFYLWFRPRRFFLHYIENHSAYLILICVWFMGIAHVIGRMDIEAAKGKQTATLYSGSWSVYFMFALIMGTVSALFIYFIGGWWYRKRINLSGDPLADTLTARRIYIYIYAAQIHVIPTILVTIVESAVYPTPADAFFGASSFWYMALLALPFWSFYISYRGVRTIFDVGRKRALLWFVILPSILASFAIALIIIGFILLMGIMPPDTSNPRYHTSPSLSFSYPGNWTIDTFDPQHDPESHLTIDMPQDGLVRILLYESDADPLEEVELSAGGFEAVDFTLNKATDCFALGPFKGKGTVYDTRHAAGEHDLRIFASPITDMLMLEIQEFYPDGDESLVLPGLELIRNSLRVMP